MKNYVTMLEFRMNARKIIKQLLNGIPFILTYRGLAVAELNPILEKTQPKTEVPPLFSLKSA